MSLKSLLGSAVNNSATNVATETTKAVSSSVNKAVADVTKSANGAIDNINQNIDAITNSITGLINSLHGTIHILNMVLIAIGVSVSVFAAASFFGKIVILVKIMIDRSEKTEKKYDKMIEKIEKQKNAEAK